VNDGVTQLLGAHAGGPGLVVASGTGSVAASRDAQGRTRQAGGWGFPVGDEGSGAWLGLHAMRHAQQVLDGRAAASPLSQAVFAQAGADATALLAWCAAAGQAAWATLAPAVFDAAALGDLAALALLDQAAADLARLVHALDAGGETALPIVMRGSVGERLVARWPEALRARVVQPAGDSCDGALRLLQGAP
jgi:glucosamine kinase